MNTSISHSALAHLPVGNMRCFHAFNGASMCAPRHAPHDFHSDAYRLNIDITLDLAVTFNDLCRARRSEFKHPNTLSTGGLFGEGLTEFSCHNDDAGVVADILDNMRTSKHISNYFEIPMHQSQTFGMATARR